LFLVCRIISRNPHDADVVNLELSLKVAAASVNWLPFVCRPGVMLKFDPVCADGCGYVEDACTFQAWFGNRIYE
jgi:hypothetical protein